jgi:hypothetical protein
MTRVQITAVLAVIVAVAATWLAHVGDELTRQIAHKAPAAPQVTRTRVITSILTADPTVVGSVTRPATTPPGSHTPAGELRR